MKTIKKLLRNKFKDVQDKYVYFYTNNPDNIMSLYSNLIESDIEYIGHETPITEHLFFVFSFDVNDSAIKYDNRLKSYFNVIDTPVVNYNPHNLILENTSEKIIFNYDIILRKAKINRLYNMCLILYPDIVKFDKDSIHQIYLPKPITKFIYDELYNKGILRKEDLEIGKYYYGRCRNASVAKWSGETFIYMRTKFMDIFPETINHLADDNGFDLFIPIKEIIPTEDEKIID